LITSTQFSGLGLAFQGVPDQKTTKHHPSFPRGRMPMIQRGVLSGAEFIVQAIAFYFLATIAVIAAFMVVTARNPVRAVMWLILTFFTTAGLFVLMGAEFIAMLLVVVYVGAVAVLFLFVVMMLDIDFAEMRAGFTDYLMPGALIGVALVAQMIFVGYLYATGRTGFAQSTNALTPISAADLGRVLYTDHVLAFQLSGLILLVAMIGAIILTLRPRAGIKRQNIAAQVQRDPESAVRLVDVRPGQGLGD
jgi:NADH-quinone oxidoreductase subunit J